MIELFCIGGIGVGVGLFWLVIQQSGPGTFSFQMNRVFQDDSKTHEQWKEEKLTDAEAIAKWRKEQKK